MENLKSREYLGFVLADKDPDHQGMYKVHIPELQPHMKKSEGLLARNHVHKYRINPSESGAFGSYYPLHAGTSVVVKFFDDHIESAYIDRIVSDQFAESLPYGMTDRDNYYQIIRTPKKKNLIAIHEGETDFPPNSMHIYYNGLRTTLVIDDQGLHITTEDNVNIRSDKKINIQAAQDINILTDMNINIQSTKDINLKSEAKINIDAVEGINIKSGKKLNLEASDNLNLKTSKDLKIESTGTFSVKSGKTLNLQSDDAFNVKSKDVINLQSDKNFSIKSGKKLNLNPSEELNIKTSSGDIKIESATSTYLKSNVMNVIDGTTNHLTGTNIGIIPRGSGMTALPPGETASASSADIAESADSAASADPITDPAFIAINQDYEYFRRSRGG